MKKKLVTHLMSFAIALVIAAGSMPCYCPNHDTVTDSHTPTCCQSHDTVTDSCSNPPITPFNFLEDYC